MADKLSKKQVAALQDVATRGYSYARRNTIPSLFRRGYLARGEGSTRGYAVYYSTVITEAGLKALQEALLEQVEKEAE